MRKFILFVFILTPVFSHSRDFRSFRSNKIGVYQAPKAPVKRLTYKKPVIKKASFAKKIKLDTRFDDIGERGEPVATGGSVVNYSKKFNPRCQSYNNCVFKVKDSLLIKPSTQNILKP